MHIYTCMFVYIIYVHLHILAIIVNKRDENNNNKARWKRRYLTTGS